MSSYNFSKKVIFGLIFGLKAAKNDRKFPINAIAVTNNAITPEANSIFS